MELITERRVHVRLFQEKDRQNIRKICHLTATAPEYVENRELVCLRYADPYMDICPEGIFVAADEADRAIGYILSVPDTVIFQKKIENGPYFDAVRQISQDEWRSMTCSPPSDPAILEKFPAHLHIDILEAWQRIGIGHRLMDTLFRHLRNEQISGIHLEVGENNVKGCNFYRKYGFQVVKKHPGSLFFAKEV